MKKYLIRMAVGVPFTLLIGYLTKMEDKASTKAVERWCSPEEEPKNDQS